MLNEVKKRAGEFDIIHFHVDLLQYPLFRSLARKCVTTLHGRLDLADLHPLYQAFSEMPLVSVSDSQRAPMPVTSNWLATVHHGLPPDQIPFDGHGGDYLVFLGRISPEKRPDRAIEVARRCGFRLKIAAKLDKVDEEYFKQSIEPLLNDPMIEYVGEVSDQNKPALLGGALALLFPIDWPEPFGLAMIEAMAAGTPVIAWRCGSVPEVVDEGKSGFVVESIDEAVAAVARAHTLDRGKVRACFEARFTDAHMARAYMKVYEHLLAASARARPTLRASPITPEAAEIAGALAAVEPMFPEGRMAAIHPER
jgi:glycosyltransferase involved in cell wall biosynthesis